MQDVHISNPIQKTRVRSSRTHGSQPASRARSVDTRKRFAARYLKYLEKEVDVVDPSHDLPEMYEGFTG